MTSKQLLRLGATLAVQGALSCTPALQLAPSDAGDVLSQQVLEAPDPGQPGPYRVLTLYYGSGTDKNRPEYRDSVTITTETVDASKLVELGGAARERNDYWGFTPREMPLNARVWYPDGDGPFPLVLVVHGNHDMTDFSDPGYDYLGELLASRGYILASVDENFLNGGIRDENDARGWFLLKHLELFRDWHGRSGNPFRGRVDMGNIAIIGHSRGGEAVANAAAFNRLSRYPDDASLEFDFGFDIRAVVSIAPVDGQYLPTGRKAVMEDVNYMVFHGSHDADVTSFHGLRIYDRLRFTDPDEFFFKTAIYVHRANHGQWNTSWGFDGGSRVERSLDLRPLLTPEEQQRFAKVYVSAFFEVTLKGDKSYLPLFRDHRVAGGWLPKTMYVTRFETSAFRSVADFEEDIDVTSGSVDGVELLGTSLETWKEQTLELRSSNRPNTSRSQENQALWLAWDRAKAAAPRFEVTLPDGLATSWGLSGAATLDFILAPSSTADEGDAVSLDLSVEVVDASGRTASVPLSDYGAIRRPFEISLWRRADLEASRYPERWEVVPQSFSIPLSDFSATNSQIDLRSLREVRLVFDRTEAGAVVVDQIGFSALDPAFLSARVEGRR